MGRILKSIALTLVIAILLGACFVANALFGNPLSMALAKRAAGNYLAEKYSGTDLEIAEASYSFKDGYYYVYIKSASSIDTHFVLMMNSLGQLKFDYSDHVKNGRNTANRIDSVYRAKVDEVLSSESIPCYVSIGFGEIVFKMPSDTDAVSYAIDMSELVIDKEYDVNELGAVAGRLTVYVEDETVSVERLSEILLGIRDIFDAAGVRFYAINCVLEYPVGDDGISKPGHLEVSDFLYSDICEPGLTERVAEENKPKVVYPEPVESKEPEIK